MALTDADVAAALLPAGLLFLERVPGDVSHPLPEGKGSAAGCQREHGRFDATEDEVVDMADPELATKLNAAWWRMATEHDLFDERREFFLSVWYDIEDPNVEPSWVRVRLLDEWDLAGSGVPALRDGFGYLFTDVFVPGFTMVSLDGSTLVENTTWGDGTASTVVIRRDR